MSKKNAIYKETYKNKYLWQNITKHYKCINFMLIIIFKTSRVSSRGHWRTMSMCEELNRNQREEEQT